MKIPITNKLFELLYDDHSVQKQCDNIAYTGGLPLVCAQPPIYPTQSHTSISGEHLIEPSKIYTDLYMKTLNKAYADVISLMNDA